MVPGNPDDEEETGAARTIVAAAVAATQTTAVALGLLGFLRCRFVVRFVPILSCGLSTS